MVESIINSLIDNEFNQYGEYFINHKLNITVNICRYEEVVVKVDASDVDENDLKDFVSEILQMERYEFFATDIIEWVEMKRQEDEECPGFILTETPEYEEHTHLEGEYLKSLVEHDENRHLTIYTWGNKLMKAKPQNSQKNFNASILNGRGRGIDLRIMNGLSDEIQKVISRCNRFDDWIAMCIRNIEDNNLHSISVNCSKGRHRSVAAAEIMKKIYYHDADIVHLTIR